MFRGLFLATCLLVLSTYANAQDFDLLCQKQSEGKNWMGCLREDFPEALMSLFVTCIKAQSNKDMVAFLTMVCQDKGERNKWMQCQMDKLKSGEATITDSDKKALGALESCARAL